MNSCSESGSALLLAQCDTQLAIFVPGNTQATGERTLAQHLHGLDRPVNRKRRMPLRPDLLKRAHDSVRVGVVSALIPGARSLRKIRIVADRIQRRLQKAMLPR